MLSNVRRYETFKIKEILTLIKLEYSKNKRIKLGGKLVNIGSIRLKTFKNDGTVCKICGLKASFFALEQCNGQTTFHLNLYGKNEFGAEVLFNSDHIIPKSHCGDKSSLSNRQTLCEKCNSEKSDRLEVIDETGIHFKDCKEVFNKKINFKLDLINKILKEFDIDNCNIKLDFKNCFECSMFKCCYYINEIKEILED
jgi:hypothetical protein